MSRDGFSVPRAISKTSSITATDYYPNIPCSVSPHHSSPTSINSRARILIFDCIFATIVAAVRMGEQQIITAVTFANLFLPCVKRSYHIQYHSYPRGFHWVPKIRGREQDKFFCNALATVRLQTESISNNRFEQDHKIIHAFFVLPLYTIILLLCTPE